VAQHGDHRPLHPAAPQSERDPVTQVIEGDLLVGGIGDARRIGRAARLRRLPVPADADGEAEQRIERLQESAATALQLQPGAARQPQPKSGTRRAGDAQRSLRAPSTVCQCPATRVRTSTRDRRLRQGHAEVSACRSAKCLD
jgi:hypothetical protein